MKRILMTIAIVLFGMQAFTSEATAGTGSATLQGSGQLSTAQYNRVDFFGSGTMKVLGNGKVWILPGVEYSTDGKVFVRNQAGAWRTISGHAYIVLRLTDTWACVQALGGPGSASTSVNGSGTALLFGNGSYTQVGFTRK